jgi:hypothetical protein
MQQITTPARANQPPRPRRLPAGMDHRPSTWWAGVMGLVVLLLVGIDSVLRMAPTTPAGADAPPETFSAARAMSHIAAIANDPRPVGSPEHLKTRTYLMNELASLGWRTEVQESVGMFDFGVAGTQSIGAVSNVIATMPGTAPTGTVLLAAHYDTVAGSPGAADDGIGVGTLLETARALNADGVELPQNNVMILLTDAEEPGLLGAEAFVRERGDELGTTVVLNHEARGVGGTPAFRMSSPNSGLLEVLSRTPRALADSSVETAFETLPNNTDFTPFTRAGLHGYDTAIVAGAAYYHSPLDNRTHLSTASLQHMGDTTLALTRELAGLDLATVVDGGEEIVTTLPWGLLRYPQTLEIPLALAALVLVTVLVWLRRRQGALSLPRVAFSVTAAAVALVAAYAAGFAVWRIALLVDPGQVSTVAGEPYRPVLYQLAMLLAGLSVVLSLYALVRHRLRGTDLAVGTLLVLALAGALLAVTVPDVSGSVVQPTLIASIGAVIAAVLPERRVVARGGVFLLALAVTVVLLAPAVWSGFDVGLGFAGPASTVLLAVVGLLAAPLIDVAWPPPAGTPRQRRIRTVVVPALLVTVVGILTAAGLVANREGDGDARQESVVYSVDADTGKAHWASRTAPTSDWARSLLSKPPTPLDDAFPWWASSALWHGPAPTADLAPPDVAVIADTTRNGIRELTLRLSSRRGAPTLGMWVDTDSATVRTATVAGRDVPTNRPEGKWAFGFLFHGAPVDGIEVRLQLDIRTDAFAVRVADRSHDLGDVPGFTPPPQGRVLVTPQVAVTRTVTL